MSSITIQPTHSSSYPASPRGSACQGLYGCPVSPEMEARLLREARAAIASLPAAPQYELTRYAVGDIGGWLIA